MAEKVVVTGGSGRAGEYIIAELTANGYEVANADFEPPRPGSPSQAAQWWDIDVTNYGEAQATPDGMALHGGFASPTGGLLVAFSNAFAVASLIP